MHFFALSAVVNPRFGVDHVDLHLGDWGSSRLETRRSSSLRSSWCRTRPGRAGSHPPGRRSGCESRIRTAGHGRPSARSMVAPSRHVWSAGLVPPGGVCDAHRDVPTPHGVQRAAGRATRARRVGTPGTHRSRRAARGHSRDQPNGAVAGSGSAAPSLSAQGAVTEPAAPDVLRRPGHFRRRSSRGCDPPSLPRPGCVSCAARRARRRRASARTVAAGYRRYV